MSDTPIHIAIFARNEAKSIEQSMDALLADSPRPAVTRLFVLINGCTDDTAGVVEQYARRHPQVTGIELPIGDKCNAWNHYVHHVADAAAPVHFFTDGDVLPGPGSLPGMLDQLDAQPAATACAGLPLSGRSREAMAQLVRQRYWLFGGLYAVRFSQLQRIREADVRLPLGLCGNDHMITRLYKTAFPDITDFQDTRITWRDGCGFTFDPLRPYKLDDVRLYLRRRVTYTLRTQQLKHVGEAPLDALPTTMDGVNKQVLAELRRRAPRPWSAQHGVRQKLEQWYGAGSDRFAPMLERAA